VCPGRRTLCRCGARHTFVEGRKACAIRVNDQERPVFVAIGSLDGFRNRNASIWSWSSPTVGGILPDLANYRYGYNDRPGTTNRIGTCRRTWGSECGEIAHPRVLFGYRRILMLLRRDLFAVTQVGKFGGRALKRWELKNNCSISLRLRNIAVHLKAINGLSSIRIFEFSLMSVHRLHLADRRAAVGIDHVT